MYAWVRLALITQACLLFTGALPAQTTTVGESAYSDLKGKQLYLRKTPNSNRKVYLRIGKNEGYYVHGASRMFPVRVAEPVTIKSCKRVEDETTSTGAIEIKFASKHLGNGKITVVASSGPVFKEAIRLAFSETADAEPWIVRSRKTGFLHYAGCNHLPPDGDLEALSGPVAPDDKRCLLCFLNTPPLSNLDFELRLGEGIAGQVHSRYAMVMDDAVQRRLRQVGASVLERWPLPLRGYKYRFYVVDSDLVNAFACPGGRIYVTSGMLDCLESEGELQAALAHEIAHIELRHGYRQFRTAQKGSFWSVLGAAMTAGISVYAGGKSNWEEVATAIGQLATLVVMAGHSREYEAEADSFSTMFLSRSTADGGQALGVLLRKLQYDHDFRQPIAQKSGLLGTHPETAIRIATAEKSEVRSFQGEDTFYGYTEEGDLVATVSFQMQRVFKGSGPDDENFAGLHLVAQVETTSALEEKDEIKDIKIWTGGNEVKLDNQEDTEIQPNDSIGASFRKRGVFELIDRIEKIELDLNHVKEWKRGES